MKKSFLSKAVAITAALMFILVSTIPAFAASPVKIKVEIAGSDGLLYVRLTAPESSDISTFSAFIKYDTSKLSFKEMSYLKDTSVVNATNTENDGVVGANTVIADSLTEKTKIFTYVFNILDTADGECEFSFDSVRATNSANKDITVKFDGPLKAVISELEPLTPDVIQSTLGGETTLPAETETETESVQETEPEKTPADSPNTPNTTRHTRTVLVISFLMISLLICGIAVKKKKREA